MLHWTYWPERDRSLDPAGYLYVIEFSMGVVKVGKTVNPRQRAVDHAKTVGRFDGSITRSWLSPPHENYHQNERALMAAGARLGRPLLSDEYFADCSFDAMTAIAASLETNQAAASRPTGLAGARRQARRERVLSLRGEGLSIPQIARAMQTSTGTVWRDLEALGEASGRGLRDGRDVHAVTIAEPAISADMPLPLGGMECA